MWLHAAAMCVFAFATTATQTAYFAIMHGLAWGIRGTLLNAIRADYFGGSSFATITGFSSLVVMSGVIVGPLVAGFLRDSFGDYRMAFLSLGEFAVFGSFAMLLLKPHNRQPPLKEVELRT